MNFWTAERDQQLAKLWPDKSATQICKILGATSRGAVCGRAQRLGLRKDRPAPVARVGPKVPKRLTDAERQEVRRMDQAGARRFDIAQHFGVSMDTVYRVVSPSAEESRRERVRKRRGTESRRLTEHDPVLPEEAAARLAEVPEDTRDLTARLLGDPIRGRDALSQKLREMA